MPGGPVSKEKQMNETERKGVDGSEILAQIADSIAELLMQLKFSETQAIEIGLKVAEAIQFEWGGEQIYIPRSFKNRDQAIVAEYNGCNSTEICHKYGITRRRLLQILQAKREGRFSQMTLNDICGGEEEK